MTDLTLGASAPVQSPELIPVLRGEIGGLTQNVVDGRALHSFLGNRDMFANWIKLRVEQYGFQPDQDFCLILAQTKIKGDSQRGGDRRSRDYHLTLDMAKELSMVENNDKGREARRYFITMERRALEAMGQASALSTAEAPALSSDTLLPSEQQTLQEIVRAKLADTPERIRSRAFAEVWSRVHNRFRVSKYDQIRRDQLAEAIVYVTQMTLRTKGAAAMPAPQTYEPAEVPAMALETAHQALQMIVEQERFFLEFNRDGQMVLTHIPRDALVVRPQDLAQAIASRLIPDAYLLGILRVVADRVSQVALVSHATH